MSAKTASRKQSRTAYYVESMLVAFVEVAKNSIAEEILTL